MPLTISATKWPTAARLGNVWAKGARPGEPVLVIKDELHRHCNEQEAELRKGAAVATILTLRLAQEEDEALAPELEARVLQEATVWSTSWAGSGPLATRARRETPPAKAPRKVRRGRRPLRRTLPDPAPRREGLVIELVLAPIRPEMRGGRETRRVVSVNKALQELAAATLGPDRQARHAEALHQSFQQHLAKVLPEVSVRLAEPPVVPEPDVIRARREHLEERAAVLAAGQEAITSFAPHATALLKAIEDELLFLEGDGRPLGRKSGYWLPEPVYRHYIQHRATHTVVLKNPAIAPGMRLMLEMVLGYLAQKPPAAANNSGDADEPENPLRAKEAV